MMSKNYKTVGDVGAEKLDRLLRQCASEKLTCEVSGGSKSLTIFLECFNCNEQVGVNYEIYADYDSPLSEMIEELKTVSVTDNDVWYGDAVEESFLDSPEHETVVDELMSNFVDACYCLGRDVEYALNEGE